MTQWYVKDLSKLTNVSVQTLHHYDRINLLKPSIRLPNGYRVYSEKDLLRLQQIIALKFFSFELSQIKSLLSGNTKALDHFAAQAQFLEEKATAMLDATKTLKSIISDVKDDKSISWETIIKLIEVYRMSQQLEDVWVKEIFTPKELKEYVAFKTELNPDQIADFEKNWSDLVAILKNSLTRDPKSELGKNLAKKFMDHVNGIYGKKYAHLRTKKFEKGFGEGKGLLEAGLTPEAVTWLTQAMDAYWRERIYKILAEVGKTSPSKVLELWNEVLDDMYGNDVERKIEFRDLAIQDDKNKISEEARKWLKSLRGLQAM